MLVKCVSLLTKLSAYLYSWVLTKRLYLAVACLYPWKRTLIQWVSGLLPREKSARGVTLTAHPPLPPTVKAGYSYTSTPNPSEFTEWCGVNFYLIIICYPLFGGCLFIAELKPCLEGVSCVCFLPDSIVFAVIFVWYKTWWQEPEKYRKTVKILPEILHAQGRCMLYLPSSWRGLATRILCG